MSLRPRVLTSIRRKLTSIVALLFVLYAVADVTVLQAYCCNEAVGIPPAHHAVKTDSDARSNDSDYANSSFVTLDAEPIPDGQPDSHDGEDEDCFCCCSHAVAGYFTVQSGIIKSAEPESRAVGSRTLHPASEPNLLFRPPQTS